MRGIRTSLLLTTVLLRLSSQFCTRARWQSTAILRPKR